MLRWRRPVHDRDWPSSELSSYICILRIALLSAIFVPGFLFQFAGAHAQEPQARGRDLNSIVSDGMLRVAMTRFDLPGFHTRNADGSMHGLEADVAGDIARALEVKAVFKADYGSFDAVAEAVASGQADIGISKLSQTYYRVTHVLFSEPYVTLRHALLYDRIAIAEAAHGGSPEDVLRAFRGRIAVIGNSAYEDFGHRNFPGAQILPMGSWDEAVRSLKEGRADAVYRDEFEVRRVLRKDPALNVRVGAAIMTDQEAFLSIAICDSCVKLQQFINYHLHEYPRALTVNDLIRMAD